MITAYRKSILSVVLFGLGCAVPIISERELAIEADGQFRQMRNQMQETRDAGLRNYVQCVTDAILAEVEPPYDSLSWDVVVFDDPSVNAFAMPGGKIGIFTGLLDVADDQDQLAVVVGHEIAHVTERHSYKQVNRQLTTQGAVLVGSAAMGGGAGMYDLLAQGAQIGLSLPRSRGDEKDADSLGLNYMANAGFDPRSSVQLWKKMDAAGGAAPPAFLSTHPSASTRIEGHISQLPKALKLYNEAQAQGKNPDCER